MEMTADERISAAAVIIRDGIEEIDAARALETAERAA
jgi:hypothetical protein